ncbi:universal stress protein [Paraglaciecola aquimarina]|uniref:Universal stress protein n=1 Tax=Paraglaciecola aquimarina TaxID=1235557 RepID=A0ABU3SWW4_9ALTE|nr:universal stress protein [Paraglaciecola aquimarina]MDU0354501.1 universal stress protein [Paraglaciecola aquimarina]
MYNTILCPIEVSPEGQKVLTKAAELDGFYNAKLIAINVIPHHMLPKDYQKELIENVIPKMESICAEFSIAKKNRFVKVGKPYEHICTLAQKKDADLIVIGTHSKKGLKALLGSTANSVVNYAECDVLLVKV